MTGKLWKQFLGDTLADARHHSLWLSSLGYLEYIGYRKMVKSVPYDAINVDVYHHLSDEIQHSFMFRESAKKTGGKWMLGDLGLQKIEAIAEGYFQALDQSTESWVMNEFKIKSSFLNYLWVSYIVEKRAMQVYPSYFSELKEGPMRVLVQKVIKDESEHLSHLTGHLSSLKLPMPLDQMALPEFESKLFKNYLDQMLDVFEQKDSLLVEAA